MFQLKFINRLWKTHTTHRIILYRLWNKFHWTDYDYIYRGVTCCAHYKCCIVICEKVSISRLFSQLETMIKESEAKPKKKMNKNCSFNFFVLSKLAFINRPKFELHIFVSVYLFDALLWYLEQITKTFILFEVKGHIKIDKCIH